MGEIQMHQMIARYGVAGADDENAAEENALNRVAGDPDVARLHVGIAVVHDDAEIAVGIALEIDVFVQTGIAATSPSWKPSRSKHLPSISSN